MKTYIVSERHYDALFNQISETNIFESNNMKDARRFAKNCIMEGDDKITIEILQMEDDELHDCWHIKNNFSVKTKKEIHELKNKLEQMESELRKEMLKHLKDKVRDLLCGTKSDTLSFGTWGEETGGTDGNNILVYFKHGIHNEGPACKLRIQEKTDDKKEDLFVEIALEYENAEIPVRSMDTDEIYGLIETVDILYQEIDAEETEWFINDDGVVECIENE